ncbi:MAG: hypothetical protein H6719_26990 [Sandaracinaceae bacterium]|nr:hypothetical protein [Sandaracinaceae bacterium]
MRSGVLILAVFAGACASDRALDEVEGVEPPNELEAPEVAAPELDARPPIVAGEPLYPETLVRLVEGDARDTERLADVGMCASCHEEVYAAWRASPHAAASFDNPWYRQAVDTFREERSPEASRFCAGCHNPVLLLADAMEEPIEPADPRAHAGVTCLVCHGIQEARADGVGSYTLSTAPVPLPDPAVPEEVAVHVAALTPDPLRTAALCGTCHRGFLGPDMGNPHHLPGVDEPTAWARSGFAGSRASRLDTRVEPATCQGCHMPLVDASDRDFATTDGRIHSHRVPGGHTALAGARNDAAQLAVLREGLTGVARVDVAAVRSGARSTRPADGARLVPGRVELDVVVRNLAVGHRFPGGTRDAQDTWLEVEVRDARGALVAEAGTRHAAARDETAHRLVAGLVDDDAQVHDLHHVQHFRAAIFDRTLAPRDAEVVRYAFELTADVAQPLSIDARLRHRRHSHPMHAAACAATRSPRGRAFAATSVALGRIPIDGCAEQPVTEVASARVWIGAGAEGREAAGGATDARFQRLFDHALALIGDVQEHLDDARPSLAAALRAAPDDAARAMVHGQLARLEGRQGRLAAALDQATRAERLIGEHPAIHRLRGDAYAQVWRWEDAAEAYRLAAEGAPLDESRWTDLARALGSAGHDEEALVAADRGLTIDPRGSSLLRSRYLALEGLGADAGVASDAYLAHRVPDALSALRLRCGQRSAWCALERLPVHVHDLRPAQGHASSAR